MKKIFHELARYDEIQYEELKDIFRNKNISRREFLHAGVDLAVAASSISLIHGHALAQTQKDQLSPEKEKQNSKIQPPTKGCFIGFYKDQFNNFSNFSLGFNFSFIGNVWIFLKPEFFKAPIYSQL